MHRLVDGSPAYSCTLLAIEAQGRRIETVEGISTDDAMHPGADAVRRERRENDGQQCGFCTPGLVMAGKAVVDRNPRPSMADVESGLSGNICRCGTYVGVRKAVYEAGPEGECVMATKYDWPAAEDRSLIGKRHNRVDGPDKARGVAKYSYDRNLDGMLFARLVTSTVAHGRIIAIDTSMAEKVKGYKSHVNILNVGDEVQWMGAEILAICADTEEHARDVAAAVNVHFESLPHWVEDEDVQEGRRGESRQAGQGRHQGAGSRSRLEERRRDRRWLLRSRRDHALLLGAAWSGGRLAGGTTSRSTHRRRPWRASRRTWPRGCRAMSPIGTVSADSITVTTPYMGGGFGSKFNIDTWGIACAKLSKKTGKPVKLMLDRSEELMVAGRTALGLRQHQGRCQARRHVGGLRVRDLVDRRHRGAWQPRRYRTFTTTRSVWRRRRVI